MADTTGTPPWEPPLAGTEAEHLAGMLERLRATFRWKADGLTLEQLTATPLPSALSLGVLLKHLAMCEDDVFAWRCAGKRPDTLAAVPEGMDVGEWQFQILAGESAAELYALWDRAAERSRERLATMLGAGGLDEPGGLEFDGVRPSKRRHVCDLIEEYGRHTGHADLLREAVDGRTGEDPPWEWRPPLADRG
jgi:hypothetical protein